MNTTDIIDIATKNFKEECRKLKITQKEIASAFNVKELTVNRMLNSNSHKLDDAFKLISNITKLTGKMAFQYTNMNLDNYPRLKLIDEITKMSDAEIEAMTTYSRLLAQDRGSDSTTYCPDLQYEVMTLMAQSYHKIIKANLTDDTYKVLRNRNEEWTFTADNSKHKLSEWLSSVGHSDMIYEEDRQEFLECSSFFGLKKYMRSTDKPFMLHYRRKIKEDYIWVSMSIARSAEYTHRNQVVLIYIQEVPEEGAELFDLHR